MLKRASDITDSSSGSRFSAGAGQQPQKSGFSEDLEEYIRIARRRLPMVMLLALLGLALGIAYAMRLTPIYTATATLILDTQGSNVVDGAAVVAGIGNNNAAIESEVELIKSYDVAERVVTKLKLDELANSTEPASPGLLSQLLAMVLSRDAPAEPLPLETDRDKVIRTTQSGITVDRKGWTYVIDIKYSSPNPALAAQVSNAFADEYLVDRLESTYEATRRANAWLSGRLDEMRKNVRESEQAVELFKAQNNIVDTGDTTLSEQQIAKLNEQLILVRAETAQARAKYEQVQAVRKRGGDVTAFADALQSGALGALKSKASEVRRELANLSAKYGNRHPSVVSARAQLSDINGQIGSEAARIVSAVQNEYRVAQSREASIEASLGELKGTQNNTNQSTVNLRELEREAEANKALFEFISCPLQADQRTAGPQDKRFENH